MTDWLGHDAPCRAFLDAFNGRRLHHAWLLIGSKGVGKASFAERAARFLLAQDQGASVVANSLAVPPRHASTSLVDAGSHPEFWRLERLENERSGALARSITVDQVRALTAGFATTRGIARYRVVILDTVDDLEAGGANALLKSLEEPPTDTVFFLVSNNPGRLLPTIRSRCRTLAFRMIGDDVMASWLADRAADPAEIAAVVQLARGSPGRALTILGLGLGEMRSALGTIIATGDRDNALRAGLAQALSLKAAAPRYEAFLELAPAMLADHCRTIPVGASGAGLDRWSLVSNIARSAVPTSADVGMTVFEICSALAACATDADALLNAPAAG